MASINDKITNTRNATRPSSTTVATTRAVSGGTLSCASLTGWPTATAVHFVTYQIDANSNPIAGTQCDWKGIVSGSDIGTLTLQDGTDSGNTVGDIVEMLPTAAWGQDLADGLGAEHNPDGTHSDINASTVNLTGAMTTDTVSEKTPGNGVTIDGLSIKDSKLNTVNSVVTTNITNAAVTAAKLATAPSRFVIVQPAVSVVSTDPANTSWTSVDLTANTSSTATAALLNVGIRGGNRSAHIRKTGAGEAQDTTTIVQTHQVTSVITWATTAVALDTSQSFDWSVTNADVDSFTIILRGYWETVA